MCVVAQVFSFLGDSISLKFKRS